MSCANRNAQLDEIATCSICLDLYKDPKSFPCLHTFCLQCLRQFINKKPGDKVNCPLCDAEFQLSKGGFEALPSNFLIQQLLEVNNSSSVTVSGRCDVTSDVKGVDLHSSPPGVGIPVDSDDTSVACRELLVVCHDKLRTCMKANDEDMKQLNDDKIKFLKEISVCEEMITKRANELKQNIESKHKVLLKDLENIKNRRLGEISTRHAKIQEQSAILVSFDQYSEGLLKGGTADEVRQSVMDVFSNTEELVKSVEISIRSNKLPPAEVSFVSSSTSDVDIGRVNYEIDLTADDISTTNSDSISSVEATSNAKPKIAVTNVVIPSPPGLNLITVKARNNTPSSNVRGSPSCNSEPILNISGSNNCHSLPNFDGWMSTSGRTNSQVRGPKSCRKVRQPEQPSYWPTNDIRINQGPSFTPPSDVLFHPLITGLQSLNQLGMFDRDRVGTGRLHHGVTCDGCRGQVWGRRHKCTVCPDYDLCESCKASGCHPQHEMMIWE